LCVYVLQIGTVSWSRASDVRSLRNKWMDRDRLRSTGDFLRLCQCHDLRVKNYDKEKTRKGRVLYSTMHSLKALRHRSYSFTC